MEFWDVLEDSQYLDAVASVRDGPKPLCKWEIPTTEQLEEWEGRVNARKTRTTERQSAEDEEDHLSVKPLTLDWYASCPIGFFFFSAFVKDQHDLDVKVGTTSNTGQEPQPKSADGPPESRSDTPSHPATKTSTQTDKLAYIRMNFLEDLIRFQKIVKSNSTDMRPSQVKLLGEMLLEYVEAPKQEKTRGNTILPKMTQIRESDICMPRCNPQRRAGFQTPAEMEAFISMNHGKEQAATTTEKANNNLVGLKGPLLEDFTEALQEWIAATTTFHRSGSEPNLQTSRQPKKENNGAVPVTEDLVAGATNATHSVPVVAASAAKDSQPHVLKHRKTDLDSRSHHQSSSNRNRGSLLVAIGLLFKVIHKVEILIYESLKRDYDTKFQAGSSQYLRMRNFLWYQDRRVVHEDFYIMRVLGRGGFGLVSGKLYTVCKVTLPHCQWVPKGSPGVFHNHTSTLIFCFPIEPNQSMILV